MRSRILILAIVASTLAVIAVVAGSLPAESRDAGINRLNRTENHAGGILDYPPNGQNTQTAGPLSTQASDLGANRLPPYRIVKADSDSDAGSQLCLGAGDPEDCYSLDLEDNPQAHTVTLENGTRLVLFTAQDLKTNTAPTEVALLAHRNGELKNLLPDLLLLDSDYRLWHAPAFSTMPLFVTAEMVWGDNEAHPSPHRFCITTYQYQQKSGRYHQRDWYVTARKYDYSGEGPLDVLEREEQTIMDRLGGHFAAGKTLPVVGKSCNDRP